MCVPFLQPTRAAPSLQLTGPFCFAPAPMVGVRFRQAHAGPICRKTGPHKRGRGISDDTECQRSIDFRIGCKCRGQRAYGRRAMAHL